jgi:hypothetical protein
MLKIETKIGTLSAETVLAAYEKTGIKPDNHQYYDEDSNSGCALTAFVEAHSPGALIGTWKSKNPWKVIGDMLGITDQEESNISAGFFGNGTKLENPHRALGYEIYKAVFPDADRN